MSNPNIIPIARPMNEAEAETCVAAIRRGLGDVRARLLELYDRQGWRVLRDGQGQWYATWRACVADRFGLSKTAAYDKVTAARVERDFSGATESLPIPVCQLLTLAPLEPAQRAGDARANSTQARPTRSSLQIIVDKLRSATLTAAEKASIAEAQKRKDAAALDRKHRRDDIARVESGRPILERAVRGARSAAKDARRARKHLAIAREAASQRG